LTDDDKGKPNDQRDDSGASRRLEGRILLDLKEPEHSQNQPSDESQTRFQRSFKWLERRRIFVELAALAVAIWYAFLTHSIVGVSQKQLDLSERPWVSADVEISQPLSFGTQGNPAIGLAITMKNVGHSLATHVAVLAVLVPSDMNFYDTSIKRQNEVCSRLENGETPFAAAPNGGYFLFPSGSATRYEFIGIDKKSVDAAIKNNPVIAPNVAMCVVGCVDYRSTLDALHHHTRFLYHLDDPNQFTIYMQAHSGIVTSGSHPELKLFPEPQQGFNAD
jgi:hypothetical protein